MARIEQATLGGGCFWCLEAVYQDLKGVQKVVSGYTGGKIKNPSYREVCSGLTGHAEVVQITYDADTVTYEELLEIFWRLHDPTTLNRQGNDKGTQYRSVIYYHDEQQHELAEASFKHYDATDLWSDPFVTEISPLGTFYPAEEYHQNYYKNNPNQGYCTYVVRPKVEKMNALYKERLKEEA